MSFSWSIFFFQFYCIAGTRNQRSFPSQSEDGRQSDNTHNLQQGAGLGASDSACHRHEREADHLQSGMRSAGGKILHSACRLLWGCRELLTLCGSEQAAAFSQNQT